jgi:hypothetical protein
MSSREGPAAKTHRKRAPNFRLIKVNRTYTIHELAARLGMHRKSVREWIRRGMPLIDTRRPYLVHGRDAIEFLKARRMQHKQACQPGQLYCVRCRSPQTPAGDFAEYRSISATLGTLIGICPVCGSAMHRHVNASKLPHLLGQIEVLQ